MKHIYFVRHGEAEGNVTKVAQDMHTPLTEQGHLQAQVVAKRVKSLPIKRIFSSDMTRAVQTAQHISDVVGIKGEQFPAFREWMTPESVRGKKHTSPEYEAWMSELDKNYHNPAWRYEDAENIADLEKRVSEAVRMLEEVKEESVLVVSHGKFLRLFLAYILGNKTINPELQLHFYHAVQVDNTGISVFEVDGDIWSLKTWNDLSHFAEN